MHAQIFFRAWNSRAVRRAILFRVEKQRLARPSLSNPAARSLQAGDLHRRRGCSTSSSTCGKARRTYGQHECFELNWRERRQCLRSRRLRARLLRPVRKRNFALQRQHGSCAFPRHGHPLGFGRRVVAFGQSCGVGARCRAGGASQNSTRPSEARYPDALARCGAGLAARLSKSDMSARQSARASAPPCRARYQAIVRLTALDQRPALRKAEHAFGLSSVEGEPPRLVRPFAAVAPRDLAFAVGRACELTSSRTVAASPVCGPKL